MEPSASMTAESVTTQSAKDGAIDRATAGATDGTTVTTNASAAALRLSPQQRLSWLTHMPAVSLCLSLQGELNTHWLRQRLSTLIAEHEALRLNLLAAPGLHVPLQTVLPAEQADRLIHWCDADPVETPLVNGIQVNHWRDGAGQQRLQLSLPAHCGDRGTLLRLVHALGAVERGALEKGALERGVVDSGVAESDAAEMTYSQYSGWLYDLQQDDDASDGHSFWAQQTQPSSSSADRSRITGEFVYRTRAPRQQLQDPPLQPASHELTLDAVNTNRLHHTGQQLNCTTDELLMTAWAIVLQRLHRSGDGTTAQLMLSWQHDCRDDYEELADCWGLFSKALPLSWHCPPAHSFHQALQTLQQAREDASEWQEYHAIERDPRMDQLRFGFEWGGEWRPCQLEAAQTKITLATISQIRAQNVPYELLLIPRLVHGDHGSNVVLELNYDAQRYDQHTAQVLLEQLQSLVLAACQNPSLRLCDLPLHSTSFEQQLARLHSVQQKRTEQEQSQNTLFPYQFSHVAARYPQVTALCDSPSSPEPLSAEDGTSTTEHLGQITYDELEQRSNQLAHALRAAGVTTESRVALYLDRGSDMIVAMLAVLKAGGAFLPLETQQPAARNLAILNSAQPQLVLTQSPLTPPSVPGLQTLLLDDPAITRQTTTAPDVSIAPEDAAYVLFTSGSSGTPKGVVVEHRQLHNYVHSILQRLDLQAGERCALVTSLAADLSYTLLFPGLLSGASLHIVARDTVMNRAAWAAYQTRHAIAHIKMVPTLLSAWFSVDGNGQDTESDLAAVLPRKTLILGGESFSAALLNQIRQQAPGLTVYNHYGPTETTVGVLMHCCETNTDNAQYRPVPLSERLGHTRVYLLDQGGQPLPPGHVGELYIAGAQVARGYLTASATSQCGESSNESQPSATQRFLPDPWVAGERMYRSGDLARYLPDGAIEIIGRADRQVKIRGFRVELDEIQAQLTALPGVRQAAVEPHTPVDGNLQLFAFVALSDSGIRVAALHSQLQERLPDYMVPTLRVVEELPLMANGKLDRQTLRHWAGQMQQHRHTTPPRNALETVLAQHWAEVLGLQQVGIDDDFFQLGGHSLAAVKLASRLHNALKLPISVNAVFSAPTVARFAAQLNQQHQPSALVSLSPPVSDTATDAVTRPNLFCFHPSTGLVHDYQPVAAYLSDWHVWGLQAMHLGQPAIDTAALSIAQLARDYVTHIRQQQPLGPYHLLGWSLGGLIAVSAAEILESCGERVAFLGLVDTQWPGQDISANAQAADEEATITALLETAIAELDSASQQRALALEARVHEQLREELAQCAAQDRLRYLVQWAQSHGLQRAHGSWQQVLLNLDYQPHTQQLLASFQPPRLRCAIHAWWAEASLNPARANRAGGQAGFTPLDCAAISGQPVTHAVIAAQHFTVLQQAEWQQQLAAALATLHSSTTVDPVGSTPPGAEPTHPTGEPS